MCRLRRYSPRYVERVNVTNTVIVNKTYITNVYDNRVTNINYRNRTVPGGVTAVTRTTFTSAEPVGRHVVRIDEREITRVRATGAAPRIDPPRQAILGMSDAARRNVRMPPQALRERQVVDEAHSAAGGGSLRAQCPRRCIGEQHGRAGSTYGGREECGDSPAGGRRDQRDQRDQAGAPNQGGARGIRRPRASRRSAREAEARNQAAARDRAARAMSRTTLPPNPPAQRRRPAAARDGTRAGATRPARQPGVEVRRATSKSAIRGPNVSSRPSGTSMPAASNRHSAT